jgi:hypothetical protein
MTTRKLHLGKLTLSPTEYGSQGNAILGIRDSGKTYTATVLAEQLYDAGIPFVAFDPIGVWRFLRVPGKGKGYQVVVAGGKHGDLPLTVATAPEIVRSAMLSGVSLVVDLFDIHLSKSAWKSIVTDCVKVLLHENSQHGLRHIFLEEASEFAPQKVLDGDVYAEIEKLARMGGNSRLGYTLINQRAQELNKAVLELCENLFLHRQRGKNAIESLGKWLDIAGATEREQIVKSLPDLPQGDTWAWIGGNNPRPPMLVHVQPKNSLHPDRRVMHGGKGSKTRKAVDVGAFVKGMKGNLAKIEEQLKANDPKALKADNAAKDRKIAELEAAATTKGKAAPDKAAIEKAEKRGFDQAERKLKRAMERAANAKFIELLEPIEKVFAPVTIALKDTIAAAKKEKIALEKPVFEASPATVARVPANSSVSPKSPAQLKHDNKMPSLRPLVVTNPDAGAYPDVEQKLLDALAELQALGVHDPARELVALMARYSLHTNSVKSSIVSLKNQGLIEYGSGTLRLTAAGADRASPAGAPRDGLEMRERITAILGEPTDKLLAHLTSIFPDDCTREELAAACGYSIHTNAVKSAIGRLKDMGFASYPAQGRVKADAKLFPERAAA